MSHSPDENSCENIDKIEAKTIVKASRDVRPDKIFRGRENRGQNRQKNVSTDRPRFDP